MFLLAGVLSATSAEAQSLSLEECHQAALEHNRTLRSSRFDLEMASQTKKEAFTNYFPQISAAGGAFPGVKRLLPSQIYDFESIGAAVSGFFSIFTC